MEARSAQDPIVHGENPMGSGQLQSYFEAAMRKYEQEQVDRARQAASRSANRSGVFLTRSKPDPPDIETESAGLPDGRSGNCDPYDSGREELRRPLVATSEAAPIGGFATQRIRVSAIADLKEFSGRDRDEDQARSWISKVKSAFLRDQAPDMEKCVVFGDLMTGPARHWYGQLGRSTRQNWKRLLECFMVQFGGFEVSVGRQYYHAKK